MTVANWREAPPFRAKRAAEYGRDFALCARVGFADKNATVIDRRYMDYAFAAIPRCRAWNSSASWMWMSQ